GDILILKTKKKIIMTKEMWLNLPVKDTAKTKEFFEKIGFTLNKQKTNETMVCFEVGAKNMTVVFWDEEQFKEYTKNEISDTKAGSKVLISFDAESREEVDETASKMFDAGGTIFAETSEIQG
ncbi:MAG: VOC family protein, partial [Pyrinomonadaceae bacterium]